MSQITVMDLAGVIYSSGKVFEGLSSDRPSTDEFLKSGDLSGVRSRHDLDLLEDLRDVANYIIENPNMHPGSTYASQINSLISRSGSIEPGGMRTNKHKIGVTTTYGRHEPPAISDLELNDLMIEATQVIGPVQKALNLFIEMSRSQPFQDGNKRTALFVANSLLIGYDTGVLLTVPSSDDDPELARSFSNMLARAYIYGEYGPVQAIMRTFGIVELDGPGPDYH